MPEIGESDTGFFCFRSGVLRSLLDQIRKSGGGGARTGELNFLPVIPLGAKAGRVVITPRLVTLEESIGVNSHSDAMLVEAFLQRAYAGS